AAPEVFLELTQLVRRVVREHRERGVAQKAQRVADGIAGLVPRIVCVSHSRKNLLPQTIRPNPPARSPLTHLNKAKVKRQKVKAEDGWVVYFFCLCPFTFAFKSWLRSAPARAGLRRL